jgi:hypothetical protein
VCVNICESWHGLVQSNFPHSQRDYLFFFFFFFFSFLGVGWDSVPMLHSPLIGLLYQPRIRDDDECGAVGGMRIGKGNRSTRRKPAAVPLCQPKIPHDLTWARTRAAAVGSRRLTVWVMARPRDYLTLVLQVLNCSSALTDHKGNNCALIIRVQCLLLASNSSGWTVSATEGI